MSRRSYACHELKQYLLRKEHPVQKVDEVIAQLQAQGWLDDHQYVSDYTRMRKASFVGPLKIIHELKAKGVDPAVITEQVLPAEVEWLDLARTLLVKRGLTTPESANLNWQNKQVRFLLQKGYVQAHILEALKSKVN